jgi:ubiquinone/menaquinone biosynthesis C-methylase UbiE
MELPSEPTQLLFFDTVYAYQRTQVLKGALELELFTAIAEGSKTAAALAVRCEAAERGVRILCDCLTITGFLIKEGDSYELTSDSAMFLDKRSPAYVGDKVDFFGGAVEFLLSPTMAGAFSDIAATVRKGGTLLPDNGSVAPNHAVWVNFAGGMGALTAVPAEQMAKLVMNGSQEKIRVLDIAAGHGRYGVAFAQQNPNAEIVAQDWPKVLEVAIQTATEAGVADRVTMLPGSAFDVEFGDDFDVVLLTNFLHHFDPPTCETLLKKIHTSLKTRGVVVTLEFVPDENRITPPAAAAFSMFMLASTPGGDAYTFSEFQQMFADAGFSSTELHEVPSTQERVLISRK